MSTEEYKEKEEFEPQDSFESDYEEEEEKPRKGSRLVLIIAVLALVGLNVFLGVNIYMQTEELKIKEKEIAALDSQRVELLAKVDSLSTSLVNLEQAVIEKDSSISTLITELEGLKAQLSKKDTYIATLEDYKRKYKDYLHFKNLAAEKEEEVKKLKIEKDEALARAKEAESANDTLTQKLNQSEDEIAKLANKVNLGKTLSGEIKEVKSFQLKRDKLRETDRADRVTKFQVKYTIIKNAIADKGTKTAYLVVKNGSTTLTQEGFKFELQGGKSIDYTYKDEIKYDGKETSSSPSFNLPGVLKAGNYTVEVYIDGKLLNSGQIVLK